jgi:hypothetical protein
MDRILSAAALLLASLISQTEAQIDTPVDLELALAVDVSRSIDVDEARLQRQGYIEAFRHPDVIHAIRSGMLGRIAVTYFEWAGMDYPEIVVGWTLIDDEASAFAFAENLGRTAPRTARRTSISRAIEFALPLFDENGVEGMRRVVDVSGDGPNNWGALVTTARDRAVAAGVTVNGLPILDDGGGLYSSFNIPDLDLYYRDCVIGGPGAFVVVAADFTDFARAVRRKLILEIAGPAPRQAPVLLSARATAVARASPPCDIGEQLMRDLFDDF